MARVRQTIKVRVKKGNGGKVKPCPSCGGRGVVVNK